MTDAPTPTPTQAEIEALVALLQRPHGNLTGGERQDVATALTALRTERDAAVARANAERDALVEALHKITKPKYGLQGIIEDGDSADERASYYASIVRRYELIARAALAALEKP